MAKEAFSLNVDLLREVLDRVNIGVYVTDTERHILLWNKRAEEITGHMAEKVAGTACWDGVLEHVDKHGHLLCYTDLCPLNRAIQLGRPSESPILVYAKKADGKRVPVSVSVAPLFDDDARVIGGIETFRDESAAVADMEFAGKIQRHMLPKSFPQMGDLRCDARYYPHDLVGGDFYDTRPLGDGRMGILVADVRGHGVSGALYTMWLKNLEDAFSALLADPAAFVSALNGELSRLMVSESFATAVYGVLDAQGRKLTYCDAGHPPLLHYHGATGTVTTVDNEGLPLGIESGEKYSTSDVFIDKGDTLLIYTDGLTDVETGIVSAPAGAGKALETLGLAGLEAIFREEATHGAGNLCERIYFRVLDKCQQVAPGDDALLLAISRDK
jgi:phosphoserine phosphatase RsbU/P